MKKRLVGILSMVFMVVGCNRQSALEKVAESYDWNWNGVAVSNDNRVFANFPRWEEGNNPALVEILDDGSLQPFPGESWNEWQPGKDVKRGLVNLNSVYISREDNHLWAVDAGDPFGEKMLPGAAKLVEIDLQTNQIANVFLFDEEALPQGSHLNDIRIDGNTVYITESGIGSILLLDRTTGKIRRVLANSPLTKANTNRTVMVEGFPLQGKDGKLPEVNADQIELSPQKDSLYFMSPFRPDIYRVATADLKNEQLTEGELEKRIVIDRKVAPLGGYIMDDKGNFYLSEIVLATRFTLMYPEVVEKLILENPIGLEDWKLVAPYTSIDQNYQNELKAGYETTKKYQLGFYYDNQWKPGYDEWVYLLTGWTKHPDYPIVAMNNARTSDMVFTQPVVYEFQNIKVPTLLIIGTRDRTAIGKNNVKDPEIAAKMGQYQILGKETQKKIPGSQLVELENVGHLPHIEVFERFIKPLKIFLKSTN